MVATIVIILILLVFVGGTVYLFRHLDKREAFLRKKLEEFCPQELAQVAVLYVDESGKRMIPAWDRIKLQFIADYGADQVTHAITAVTEGQVDFFCKDLGKTIIATCNKKGLFVDITTISTFPETKLHKH